MSASGDTGPTRPDVRSVNLPDSVTEAASAPGPATG